MRGFRNRISMFRRNPGIAVHRVSLSLIYSMTENSFPRFLNFSIKLYASFRQRQEFVEKFVRIYRETRDNFIRKRYIDVELNKISPIDVYDYRVIETVINDYG